MRSCRYASPELRGPLQMIHKPSRSGVYAVERTGVHERDWLHALRRFQSMPPRILQQRGYLCVQYVLYGRVLTRPCAAHPQRRPRQCSLCSALASLACGSRGNFQAAAHGCKMLRYLDAQPFLPAHALKASLMPEGLICADAPRRAPRFSSPAAGWLTLGLFTSASASCQQALRYCTGGWH